MDAATFHRQHRDAAEMGPYYVLAADCWDGSGGFAAPLDEDSGIPDVATGAAQDLLPASKVRSYILRHPEENQQKFLWRVRNATYANFVRSAGETLLGFLSAAKCDRVWPEGWDWKDWEQDVDGCGTTLNDHLMIVAQRLLLDGTVTATVDRPAEEVPTLADAKAAGLRTVVSLQLPESLYDWRATPRDALTGAKFVDEVDDGGLLDGPSAWQRCRIYVPGAWETWRQDVMGADPSKVGEGPLPTAVGVPVVMMGLDRPLRGGMLGTTIFRQLCDEQLGLYREMSLLFEHIHAQAFAILCRPKKEGGNPGAAVLGTDNCLNFDKDGAAPLFIAPPGSVADVLFKTIQARIDRIYQLVGLDALNGGKQAESGISRQWRFNPLNRRLSAIVKRLVQYERRIIRLRAAWEGRDPDVAIAGWSVSYPDNFDVRDVERSLKLAMDSQTFDLGRTAENAIRKMVRNCVIELHPDAVEESDKEIDAAADEAEAIAKKRAAAMMAGPAVTVGAAVAPGAPGAPASTLPSPQGPPGQIPVVAHVRGLPGAAV